MFIVGADRSGTTLLRLYLNASSQISIPSESWFIVDLLSQFSPDAVLDEKQLEWALTTVTAHRRWRDWRCDAEEVRERLNGRHPIPLSEVVAEVFRLETAPAGKPRWGDKTPEHVFHIGQLAAMFPQAQFVHIIRDGRDVGLSHIDIGWRHRGRSPFALATYWARCIHAGRCAGDALGAARYHEVHYEDLVADPRTTLEGVCAFLGLQLEERILRFFVDAQDHLAAWELDKGIHSKLLRAPNANDVARWQRDRRRLTVHLLGAAATRELQLHGYVGMPQGPQRAALYAVGALHDALWVRTTRPLAARLARRVRPTG